MFFPFDFYDRGLIRRITSKGMLNFFEWVVVFYVALSIPDLCNIGFSGSWDGLSGPGRKSGFQPKRTEEIKRVNN